MKKLEPVSTEEVLLRLQYIIDNPKVVDIGHELNLILHIMYDKDKFPDYICSRKTCID